MKKQASVILQKDIEINGQSFHIVGRSESELASEEAAMRERYTVASSFVRLLGAWNDLQAVPAYVERSQSL